MTTEHVPSELTQAEKAEVEANDRSVRERWQRLEDERRALLDQNREYLRQLRERGATYADVAESESDIIRGRHAEDSKTISSLSFLQQPEGSPWAQSQVPDEPPLGYAIDAAPEPVGTAQEIQASLSASEGVKTFPADAAPGDGGDDAEGPLLPSAGALPPSTDDEPEAT